MVIFELPKDTEQIQILGNTYEVDIADFNVITEIQALPCMADKFRPAETEIEYHITEMQKLITRILGSEINFLTKSSGAAYIAVHRLLKYLLDFYIEKQAEYLDANYAIKADREKEKQDELERYRLLDSIYKNMPKEADKNEQPNARTN